MSKKFTFLTSKLFIQYLLFRKARNTKIKKEHENAFMFLFLLIYYS